MLLLSRQHGRVDVLAAVGKPHILGPELLLAIGILNVLHEALGVQDLLVARLVNRPVLLREDKVLGGLLQMLRPVEDGTCAGLQVLVETEQVLSLQFA